MAQYHNDIYSIVERLRMLEEGLDKNQQSVNQLGATFRPKTVAVLTSPKDPKNPLAGKLVGGESTDPDDEPLEEGAVAEDVLEKVKKSLADYLSNIADEIKQDSDLKTKSHDDTDLKSKEKKDRDLVAKESTTQSSAVKTIALEDGSMCEVHGNDAVGFEIRHGNRAMKSKFKTMTEAEMALEMFNARMRARRPDEHADYLEEK